jgi:hypothetical protein
MTRLALEPVNASAGIKGSPRPPSLIHGPPVDDGTLRSGSYLALQDGALTFTNSALQNYAIGFDPHPDGTFTETHVDVGGDIVEIQGRINGGILNADVTNPPCEHHWRLEKK